MRRALAVLCAAALCISPASAGNVVTPKKNPVIRIAPPAGIPSGERLRYEVRWIGVPIGTGEIAIEEASAPGGEPAVRITATAKANAFLASFYPVTDVLTTLARPGTYHAIVSEKDLREGRYRAHERVDFDPGAKVARWRSFKSGDAKDIPLDGPCHDPLSALYWFRTLPLEPGRPAKTVVNADEKNWDFSVDVLRTEKVELRNLGAFDAFVARPDARFKGVLVDRGRAWVWFTADERRIPLKIKLETPYGPVLGIIESVPEKV